LIPGPKTLFGSPSQDRRKHSVAAFKFRCSVPRKVASSPRWFCFGFPPTASPPRDSSASFARASPSYHQITSSLIGTMRSQRLHCLDRWLYCSIRCQICSQCHIRQKKRSLRIVFTASSHTPLQQCQFETRLFSACVCFVQPVQLDQHCNANRNCAQEPF
jgi:hypothetical protein